MEKNIVLTVQQACRAYTASVNKQIYLFGCTFGAGASEFRIG